VAGVIGGYVLLAKQVFLVPSTFGPELETCLPPILSVHQQPDALQYRARPVIEPGVAIADIPEPAIPVEHSRIKGRVLLATRDPAVGVWVIQTYAGKHWVDSQHLYFFIESTGMLREIEDYADDHVVSHPTVLHTDTPTRSFVAFSVAPYNRFAQSFEYELWTFELPNGPLRHVTNGYDLDASPDHTRATFLRSDDMGFHVIHAWNVSTGELRPVISMWESDPLSGASFSVDWTPDSKAVRITGDTLGFESSRDRWRWMELDLVCLVGSNEMVSLR